MVTWFGLAASETFGESSIVGTRSRSLNCQELKRVVEIVVPFLAQSKAIGEASFLPGQFPEFVLMYLYSS
jgi:hypothetical protein